jgi:hypothetical protein
VLISGGFSPFSDPFVMMVIVTLFSEEGVMTFSPNSRLMFQFPAVLLYAGFQVALSCAQYMQVVGSKEEPVP